MEFIDTQIVSYKFNNNKNLFSGEIRGKYISSIVALEFLKIMKKKGAKMYPAKLKGWHPGIKRSSGSRKMGKHLTDRCIIDFRGELDSIIIYSNEAISELINTKNIDILLFYAKNSLEKDEYKKFYEKVKFLMDNDIVVVPITSKTIQEMQSIYEDIKKEYNFKNDYRNSIMDLLILATAIEKKKTLITKDKVLNDVIKKCCGYLDIKKYPTGISSICYREECEPLEKKNNNKGYVNNGWKFFYRKIARQREFD